MYGRQPKATLLDCIKKTHRLTDKISTASAGSNLSMITKQGYFEREDSKSNGHTKGNRFGARAAFASSIVNLESQNIYIYTS